MGKTGFTLLLASSALEFRSVARSSHYYLNGLHLFQMVCTDIFWIYEMICFPATGCVHEDQPLLGLDEGENH